MKKVLIFAYCFPPVNMPGAFRAYSWAKYLHKFGYYPVVITRNWENAIEKPSDVYKKAGEQIIHEVRENYEIYILPYYPNLRDRIFVKYNNRIFHIIRKLLTFLQLFLQNFFIGVVPFNNFYKQACQVIKENKDIELIIATANPYVLFHFSYKLAKKFNIKWVADYRDNWSTRGFDMKSDFLSRILQKIERRSEKKWVGTAACHLEVSPCSTQRNNDFLKFQGFTIHNGFMSEDIIGVKPSGVFDDFTITYIGSLYSSQKIELFLNAFKKYIENNKIKSGIRIFFPGLAYDPVQEERIRKELKGFEDFFEITNRLPKKEIIDIQLKSHVFLYSAHNVRGVIGSKLYEYVSLKKPVILAPSDNDVNEEVLMDSGVGIICNTTDEAYKIIGKLHNDFYSNNGIKININQEKIDFYSRENQTKILAGIFDEILSGEI